MSEEYEPQELRQILSYDSEALRRAIDVKRANIARFKEAIEKEEEEIAKYEKWIKLIRNKRKRYK